MAAQTITLTGIGIGIGLVLILVGIFAPLSTEWRVQLVVTGICLIVITLVITLLETVQKIYKHRNNSAKLNPKNLVRLSSKSFFFRHSPFDSKFQQEIRLLYQQDTTFVDSEGNRQVVRQVRFPTQADIQQHPELQTGSTLSDTHFASIVDVDGGESLRGPYIYNVNNGSGIQINENSINSNNTYNIAVSDYEFRKAVYDVVNYLDNNSEYANDKNNKLLHDLLDDPQSGISNIKSNVELIAFLKSLLASITANGITDCIKLIINTIANIA